MLVTSIFSFTHNVFYPIQEKLPHCALMKLPSANAFNLDKYRTMSSVSELSESCFNKQMKYNNMGQYAIIGKVKRTVSKYK